MKGLAERQDREVCRCRRRSSLTLNCQSLIAAVGLFMSFIKLVHTRQKEVVSILIAVGKTGVLDLAG